MRDKKNYVVGSGVLVGLSSALVTGAMLKENIKLDTQQINKELIIENQSLEAVMLNENNITNMIYLSDINYVSNKSSVGWGSITYDKTADNKSISLIVKGNPFTFKKGIFAHATSNVIYDLTNYSEYAYFSTYYGVSSHMGTKGSVKFKIYTSEDGKDWKLETEENPQVMTGSTEAKYVKIDIRGKKFLKLSADSNGGNGQDHSIYADAKLITEDYNDNVTKSVEEYDELLKKYEGQEITGEYEQLLLQRELVNKTGELVLNTYAHESKEQETTLNWLLNTPDVLKMYIYGGAPDGSYYNSLVQLSRIYTKYKDDFSRTDLTRTKLITYGELYKKIAISTSLSHSTKVYLWMQPSTKENISDAVERYQLFKYLHDNDMFVVVRNEDGSPKMNNGKPVLDHTPIFESLEIEEMRYVVNNIIDNESIIWLNEYTQQYIDANQSQAQLYLQPHSYMNYIWPNYAQTQFHNASNKDYYNIKYGVYKNWSDRQVLKGISAKNIAKQGLTYNLPDASKIKGIFSDYGVSFRNGLYKLWMNIEGGAVCGGISKIGSNIRAVHGLPSSVISQPGHAALIYYQQNANGDGYWNMDNGINGWGESGKTERMHERMPLGWGNESFVSGWAASYIAISQDVINRFDNYIESKKLVLLADSYQNDKTKYENYLRQAIGIEKRNLDAWERLAKLYINDKTKTYDDYYNLAKEISESLKYYPLPMYNILEYLKPYIIKGNTENEKQQNQFRYTLLLTKTLKEGKNATSSNIKTMNVAQPSITNQVANYLLGQTDTSLASFSFDGSNSGSIVLSSRFNGSGIRFDYSLDGGNTWIEHSFTANESHILKLTDEEINSITSVDDIKVHIIGSSYTNENIYTIDITNGSMPTNLYLNDLENRVIGITNIYEWRIKGTTEWTSIAKDNPRFTGNVTIEMRIAATGTKLASNIKEYTFTDDKQLESRRYIPIEHLSIASVSSEATGNNGHAIHAIDANINTIWHSNYSGADSNRYIVIKLDEPKYISALEYIPRQSGTNGRVKNGILYLSMDGINWTEASKFLWGNDAKTKTINLSESIQAQYIKFQATSNYGDGRNFISALMINLFEDLNGDFPKATVEYNKTTSTTESVIAKLIPTKDITITDSEGVDYEKLDDGTFEFEIDTNKTFNVSFKDKNEKKGNAKISVNWIVDYDFSFNSDNTATINIGEKYLTTENEIEWKYSIDGGNTWKLIENKLTANIPQEEIQKMNEIDGIKLSINFIKYNQDAIDENKVQVNEDGTISATISVLSGKNIPENTIYANDLENKLFGIDEDNMEWRFIEFDDKGLTINKDNSYKNIDDIEIISTTTWKRFKDETPNIIGNKKIQVRYIAHDSTLPGKEKTYRFTTIEQDENHTYIPVNHYSISEYSSHTPGKDEIVTNAIDGNIFTNWHTDHNTTTDKKYIVIKLDNARWLSKVETISRENYLYGVIKEGLIEVSLDGKTWTKVATCNDEKANSNEEVLSKTNKTFEFEPIYAQYIRITNITSHDYISGIIDQTTGLEANWFFNLSMINLYEDTESIIEETIILVDYNATGITNQNVTATIYSPNKKMKVTNNSGSNTYTFTKNGQFEFEYDILNDDDIVIESGTYIVEIGPTTDGTIRPNIDKDKPTASIALSEKNLTNQDVTATVIFDEPLSDLIILTPESEYETNTLGYPVFLFNENGTKYIKVKDQAGNISDIEINVNNIDKVLPNALVSYSTTEITKDDIKVTLTFDKTVIIESTDFQFIKEDEEGKVYSAIFKQNINDYIYFKDIAGNTNKVNVKIENIDKTSPQVLIKYSTRDETYDPVTVTLIHDEDITIENNNGLDTYIFTKNGTFTFQYKDKDGNIGYATAIVGWIQSRPIKASIEYSTTKVTTGDVMAILVTDKKVNVINNAGSLTYIFKESGSFTFIYEDEDGNRGEITAEVNWIDKSVPKGMIVYDKFDQTYGPVTATLILDEGIKIINNGGSNKYIFTKNGEFEFIIEGKNGIQNKVIASVSWIDDKQTIPEIPNIKPNEQTTTTTTTTTKKTTTTTAINKSPITTTKKEKSEKENKVSSKGYILWVLFIGLLLAFVYQVRVRFKKNN